MKKSKFDLIFARQMAKKYSGRFVAVINEKVVAAGSSRMAVFHKAQQEMPKVSKIGVYYFPTQKELLTAL